MKTIRQFLAVLRGQTTTPSALRAATGRELSVDVVEELREHGYYPVTMVAGRRARGHYRKKQQLPSERPSQHVVLRYDRMLALQAAARRIGWTT